MQAGDTYRTEEILQKLRGGGTVRESRQSGKSTALLMLAHELGADNCTVVATTWPMLLHLKNLWWRLYDGEKEPLIVRPYELNRARGTSRKYLLVDEFRLCGITDYYAAVGT